MLHQFLFKAKWYSDFKEDETVSYGIVVAESLSEATAKLCKRLPYLSDLKIKEIIEGDDFIWFGKTFYKAMVETSEANEDGEYDRPPFYTEEEWREEG